jgi:thiol-disulfide isomerase/thioredoxin
VCLACTWSDAGGQAHEPDPEALRAFKDLVESYRQRPALEVETTIEIAIEQDGVESARPKVKAAFTLGRGRVGIVKLQGFTCYISGGKLAAVHESTDHSYFSAPDEGSPFYALMNAFVYVPFPHLAIAFGEEDIAEVCMQFHQAAPWVQPTGVDTVTRDGRTLRRIRLTSDFDDMQVLYDPDTKLIEAIDLKVTGGHLVDEGATMAFAHSFKYKPHDEPLPASAFALDPGPRQRVDLMPALVAKTEAAPAPPAEEAHAAGLVGAAAPDFVLGTADGGAVDLAALRGRVVVLDFWATWCGPCKKALPLLHEVARWARDQDVPVEILTVNIWDQGQGDERLERVRKFWQKNGFTLPVVVDHKNQTVDSYKISGVPVTVVIRADGVVHAHHVGVVDDYAETLKADITGAIEALEAD